MADVKAGRVYQSDACEDEIKENLEFPEKYMEYDCGFEKGNNWFRYRTGAILIHDNKMLFVKSAIGDYYYMNILDNGLDVCKNMTDEGEELVWLPIDEIKENKIKPRFVREYIDRIIGEGQMIHVIEERDK